MTLLGPFVVGAAATQSETTAATMTYTRSEAPTVDLESSVELLTPELAADGELRLAVSMTWTVQHNCTGLSPASIMRSQATIDSVRLYPIVDGSPAEQVQKSIDGLYRQNDRVVRLSAAAGSGGEPELTEQTGPPCATTLIYQTALVIPLQGPDPLPLGGRFYVEPEPHHLLGIPLAYNPTEGQPPVPGQPGRILHGTFGWDSVAAGELPIVTIGAVAGIEPAAEESDRGLGDRASAESDDDGDNDRLTAGGSAFGLLLALALAVLALRGGDRRRPGAVRTTALALRLISAGLVVQQVVTGNAGVLTVLNVGLFVVSFAPNLRRRRAEAEPSVTADVGDPEGG